MVALGGLRWGWQLFGVSEDDAAGDAEAARRLEVPVPGQIPVKIWRSQILTGRWLPLPPKVLPAGG